MRTIILLSLNATFLITAAPPTIKETVPSEITRLEACIQTRFLDRKAFGMSRVAILDPHGIRTFRPESPTEDAVVNDLRQRGFEVVAYLVGRQALGAPIVPARRAGLQGPAQVVLLPATKVPNEATLLAAGRSALSKDSANDVKTDGWNVAIRPLRASNQGCIDCHTTIGNAPKLGDAIGVVLYVYRQRN
jgi:hypothetical protein